MQPKILLDRKRKTEDRIEMKIRVLILSLVMAAGTGITCGGHGERDIWPVVFKYIAGQVEHDDRVVKCVFCREMLGKLKNCEDLLGKIKRDDLSPFDFFDNYP